MKIFLFLLIVLQLSCQKPKCKAFTFVPVHIEVENLDLLRSIELKIYASDRIVMADIIYPMFFTEGLFEHYYPIEDETGMAPIRKVYRYYSHDGSWVEDRD